MSAFLEGDIMVGPAAQQTFARALTRAQPPVKPSTPGLNWARDKWAQSPGGPKPQMTHEVQLGHGPKWAPNLSKDLLQV